MKSKLFKLSAMLYFGVLTGLCFQTNALAYVDPATTAMMVQIVAGIFITLGVAFGVFRRKIFAFFKNMSINRAKRKIEKEARKKKDT